MSEKTYSQKQKRVSITLFLLFNLASLGILLLPLYWFWDRIAAKPPSVLVIVGGLTAYLIYTWSKFTIVTARRIIALPES